MAQGLSLIRNIDWIDFILGNLVYDENHLTSRDFSNHPRGYSFPFQAINMLKSMVMFFLWTKRCSLHFEGSYSTRKIMVNAWTAIIEIGTVTWVTLHQHKVTQDPCIQ
jgi:hypothetical protein